MGFIATLFVYQSALTDPFSASTIYRSMPLSKHELETALAHLARGDWQAAHEIVQKDEASSLSCWLHAIVHLMEGDEANARYWYGAAKRPFPDRVDIAAEIRAARAELRP